MANTYFKFKQFEVDQAGVAMKVCTDACLFGAWASAKLANATNILDIGTGTGLLSLMIAQQTHAHIDAIDIDLNAYEKAASNFQRSPWPDRLTALHGAVQDFAQRKLADRRVYDTIVSNPPFFERSLQSPDAQRTVALHDGGLLLSELLTKVKHLLAHNGVFLLMLPFTRRHELEIMANSQGLFVQEEVCVAQTVRHGNFRIFYQLSTEAPPEVSHSAIVIRDETHKYTKEFMALLGDYYL